MTTQVIADRAAGTNSEPETSDKQTIDPEPKSRAYAQMMDKEDKVRNLRDEFFIPDKSSFEKKIESLPETSNNPIIYLAGSAIGLQPRTIHTRTQTFLNQWASQAISAGFGTIPNSDFPSWIEAEEVAAKLMAPIVGAKVNEVICMGSLTTNLHLLLASFYRIERDGVNESERTKILIEEGAFASDSYAVESHLQWHNLDPYTTLIHIPVSGISSAISTSSILSTIGLHASTTAILLLSGVQFHTGQLLDIPCITAYARERGIIVGWDLAHAVGNVNLKLHEWDVDFAVWCSYKYLNAGPGATAGIFVHERHGKVDRSERTPKGYLYRRRLAGWWGMPVPQRFAMGKSFEPAPGAAGFQLSSPSILDITALTAALGVFDKTDMKELVRKSWALTGYLEALLDYIVDSISYPSSNQGKEDILWTIITPRDPKHRGAMLSLRWFNTGVLRRVVERLKRVGIIVDMKRPDIMRVTPTALYNTFEEVWKFTQELKRATEAEMENIIG